MPVTDYLIVGAGVAGLTLSEYMDASQLDFYLMDSDLPGKSTAVSAGLINPVTGIRFVLSWKFPELENEFIRFYRSLENKYQIKLLAVIPLYQHLKSDLECNAWMIRNQDPLYEKYIAEITLDFPDTFVAKKGMHFGIMKNAWRVDARSLLTVVSNSVRQLGKWIDEVFDYSQLVHSNGQLLYKDLVIKKAIVFAEGFRIIHNPYFNKLPFMPLKGDCTIFYSKELKWEFILKDEFAIVPMGDDFYWCGSNFSMHDDGVHVDPKLARERRLFIESYLHVDYEIINDFSGIRPAIRDRRPVIGFHPADGQLGIFNGLGTKGFSLAPYMAKLFTEHLIQGSMLPKEVSILRFLKYFH
ncbi:MAG: FAD-binding oxidoreductase [Saprospiraceae bacterium]|nr:FAD-binding oxidoreductase [Saprospiraceae bacterium]